MTERTRKIICLALKDANNSGQKTDTKKRVCLFGSDLENDANQCQSAIGVATMLEEIIVSDECEKEHYTYINGLESDTEQRASLVGIDLESHVNQCQKDIDVASTVMVSGNCEDERSEFIKEPGIDTEQRASLLETEESYVNQCLSNIECATTISVSDSCKEERSGFINGSETDTEQSACLFGGDIESDVNQCQNGIEVTTMMEKNIVSDKCEEESSFTNGPDSDTEQHDCIFGSDFSDEDPSYVPPKSKQNLTFDIESPEEISDPDDIGNRLENSNFSGAHENAENVQEIVSLVLDDVLNAVCQRERKKYRWSKSSPSEWKKNVVKKRRSAGLTYVTNKKLRHEKIPQKINCEKCKFKCTNFFSPDERNHLCRTYWEMDFKSKKNFILSNIIIEAVKTRRVVKSSQKKDRSFTKKCFFKKNNKRIQVCQKFFTKTLCICPDVITDAVKKVDLVGCYGAEDLRGRHEPPNKIKQEVLLHVKSHIESFPAMESHYTRKDTSRKYLDANLTIRKMYQLYLEKCQEDKLSPVSEMKYRSVFCQEYNLSFFTPKKDQCLMCTTYNKADPEKKEKMKTQYEEHITRNKISQALKQEDKERANRDSTFSSVSFDLQAVLQIPSGQVSQLYYTRKLVVYNLTIYESALPNNAFCLCWSEINGKKGSCEIGTCLYYYLKECVPSDVNHITLFSDTCGGQNRNQFIASLLLWAVQNIDHLNIIEQKFLESGHTYMEADSMHSSIEYAKKNISINSMNDWLNVFKMARRKRVRKEKGTQKKHNIEPYKVKEFKYCDMLNLKALASKIMINKIKDNNNETVKWMKIKRLKYVKGETDKIYFNYDLSDDFKFIETSDISNKTRPSPTYETRVTRMKTKKDKTGNLPTNAAQTAKDFPITLEKLYKGPLSISVQKKNDLIKLCKKEIIPEELHGWINSLPTSSSVTDCVPDVSIDESSEEEELI